MTLDKWITCTRADFRGRVRLLSLLWQTDFADQFGVARI